MREKVRRSRPITGVALLASLLAAGSTCFFAAPSAADESFREEEVKATFLYHLSSFVEWPPNALLNDEEIEYCVMGRDPFGPALDFYIGHPAQGRKVVVRRLASEDDWSSCQVLYIGAITGESHRVRSLLESLRPILTVSDLPRFTCDGGIVRFFAEDDRVRLEINLAAARRAGLNMSSGLLSLARVLDERTCAKGPQ